MRMTTAAVSRLEREEEKIDRRLFAEDYDALEDYLQYMERGMMWEDNGAEDIGIRT